MNSCAACAIDREFVAADGRGLVARSQKIACGSEVCMRNPRIIAQKLGSEVCAAKSSDGPNPYFDDLIFLTELVLLFSG